MAPCGTRSVSEFETRLDARPCHHASRSDSGGHLPIDRGHTLLVVARTLDVSNEIAEAGPIFVGQLDMQGTQVIR